MHLALTEEASRRITKPKCKQKAQLCFIEKSNTFCQELGKNLNSILMIEAFQVLQSDLVWTHIKPFSGLVGDLHFGNQKVTLKKLIVDDICISFDVLSN